MIAITRAVSPALDRCELSHLERAPIDRERAARQHLAYEQVLKGLGCRVIRASPAPDLPDSVFVEDTAVVVDEIAVVARPGAVSRRAEVAAVAEALAAHRPLRRIEDPATLDGGDVLRVGRTIWVGLSARTNSEGAAQLARILEPYGYEVRGVEVAGCLHLKTAVTEVAGGALLVNPEFVNADCFGGYDLVEAHPEEPYGANVLRIGDTVVVPAAHARTRGRLVSMGIRVVDVEVSELAKAEAGVTCCSIILAEDGG